MQSLKWGIGSKIWLKWTVPWFSVLVDQTNLKLIWKFSLSQYRCHKTPIDVENCVKSALNSNRRKQNFMVIIIWGGGDYQLRSALTAKQIWVEVITIWGTLDSLPPTGLCQENWSLSYVSLVRPTYCTIGLGQYMLLSGRLVQTGQVLFEFKFTMGIECLPICILNLNYSINT